MLVEGGWSPGRKVRSVKGQSRLEAWGEDCGQNPVEWMEDGRAYLGAHRTLRARRAILHLWLCRPQRAWQRL